MFFLRLVRPTLLAGLVVLTIIACQNVPLFSLPDRVTPNPASTPIDTPQIMTDARGLIRVVPLPIAPALRNPWTPELEAAFWQRANQVIHHFAGRDYGNTFEENEKRSYPYAMFDFLAGDRQQSLAFLQQDDAQAQDHQHTAGIDYYFSFTLKGQIRKYFFFGKWLDPAYRARMREGARLWTTQDPLGRPHPLYGNGDGSGRDWSIRRRGGWVDSRNTDNLRAMREVAVYLMAEETGNEDTRQQYKERLQRYIWALYHIGMGEWDSETYHGHTFAAYLNLYDFAKDPEVQRLAKAALDWLSAAAATKYYHGGWAAPIKRDYGGGNVVMGAPAARLFWLYFGNTPAPNLDPERDVIHVITSAYRPPLAVMALAHKQIDRPVEWISNKPIYENWKSGGEDAPAYQETTFLGHTYQMGSVVSSFADGDVGVFKLLVDQSQRGVDVVTVNTGEPWVKPGKHRGDQVGQYRNLLIWLSPAAHQPFAMQLPKTAKVETDTGIWFIQLEQTWLAVHPIHLSDYAPVTAPSEKYAEEQGLLATAEGDGYAGFVLEVGEPQTHGDYTASGQRTVFSGGAVRCAAPPEKTVLCPDRLYLDFKTRVKQRSRLDQGAIAQGTVKYTSSTGTTLQLTHNSQTDLPVLVKDGMPYDWAAHWDLYRPVAGEAPISLGWKQGRLRVIAGGEQFETMVGSDRLVH